MGLPDLVFLSFYLMVATVLGYILVQESRRLSNYALIIALMALMCTLGSLLCTQQRVVFNSPIGNPVLAGVSLERLCNMADTVLNEKHACYQTIINRGFPLAITQKVILPANQQTSTTLIGLEGSVVGPAVDYACYFSVLAMLMLVSFGKVNKNTNQYL